MRPIDQQLFRRYPVSDAEVVAEPVRGRLQWGEGVRIGLRLRSIGATRREGNLYVVPGLFRSFLNRRASSQNDQVSQRDLLPADCELLKSF